MNRNKSTVIISILTLLLGTLIGALFFSDGPEGLVESIPAPLCAGMGAEDIFTCSMHPNVKKASDGQCPLCGMPLLAATSSGYHNPFSVNIPEETIRRMGIRTVTIKEKGAIDKEIRLNGKVVADESRVVSVVANLPGRIEKLFVNKTGQYIHKGQPIVSIYSRDLISVLESFKYNRNSESIIRAARNNLKTWDIPEERLSEFDMNGNYRKPITIYSNVSGVVTKKFVKEGDHAANSHMGQPTVMYEVADLSSVWVEFDAYEADLPWIKEGDRIQFEVTALPGEQFHTVVSHIDPFLNDRTRTAKVRIEVNNPTGTLKPEMLATAVLKAQIPAGQEIVIPTSAVLWTGPRSVVYIKDPDYSIPVFECRKVHLGKNFGKVTQVIEGLSIGEEVVVNGAFTIDAAAQLENKNSMMNDHDEAEWEPDKDFADLND